MTGKWHLTPWPGPGHNHPSTSTATARAGIGVRQARHRRLAEIGLLAASLGPRDARVAPWESTSPKESLPRRMAVYAAIVEQMDRGIGRLLAALERLFKSFVHEGGIATPFIARWPGVIQAGTTGRQVGHVIDLLPTLLAAAGVPPRPREWRDLFHGDADEPRTLFWEHEGNRAVRRGYGKLVALHGGLWELLGAGSDRARGPGGIPTGPRARASGPSTTAGRPGAGSSPG